jgi:hypothetical protein
MTPEVARRVVVSVMAQLLSRAGLPTRTHPPSPTQPQWWADVLIDRALGGKGSGDYGHSGRKGLVGGSIGEDGSASEKEDYEDNDNAHLVTGKLDFTKQDRLFLFNPKTNQLVVGKNKAENDDHANVLDEAGMSNKGKAYDQWSIHGSIRPDGVRIFTIWTDHPPGTYANTVMMSDHTHILWEKIKGAGAPHDFPVGDTWSKAPLSKALKTLEAVLKALGGEGSGNWEHAGRPGEVGGSSPGGKSSERIAIENAMMGEMTDVAKEIGKPQLVGGLKWPSQSGYEIRGLMKARVVKENAKEMAKELKNENPADLEKRAQQIVDQWANTSGDHSNRAVGQQEVVRQAFGLHEDTMSHMGAKPAATDHIDVAYLHAEYIRTQQFLKDSKVEYVTVYRGQGGLPSGHTSGELDVTMQPASSWSTSFKTSKTFASSHMMAVRVPAARVLSTAATGRGCLNESEVLLIGGHMKVFAVDRHSANWEKSLKASVSKKSSKKGTP